MRKSIRDFIKEHRTELDSCINSAMFRYDGRGGRGTIPDPPPSRNDDERRQWVMNDEGLYSWFMNERRY